MQILIGLGNIGKEYLRTRHNCGFMVLDHLCVNLEKEGVIPSWHENSKLNAITAKITYQNKTILLAKPTTFMNNSGEAVAKILNFFKETKENLTIIYDDIDLPLGKIRIREEGSAGTHNGMKSIIEHLGSEEFKRIRIGIESRGEHSPSEQDLHSFVLSEFNQAELPVLKQSLEEATKEIKISLTK